MENKKYKCNECGFRWYNPNKSYSNCPECQSENIAPIESNEETSSASTGQSNIGRRGGNRGGGPPRACKCHQCGYETTKTPGVPCRNQKCPECGTPLCGSD